ncbi:branched-chain amino acid ABC transporter permease [Bartonella sp. HY329]|uniref:branched-chain amino acid ABC transporter permease n=1 Tax=unclassified Bartonella TaxID=2645622 RepID=UPI0021C69B90|nr:MULTISPECIES: branched-chain amino acid ABC transporter permease [unclassified Bartonella]UXM95928.1 branched-chain amino acid ABC transporter permease [Bartonella sp. HY329]UXN10253.1 branched-chain amino acid ABC transporter permease [Bartonella sp. HY328]
MSTEMFIQHFFNALALGSLYGLIAIGYTMVYGILRLINFAHGDIFMLGAYFVFFSTISFMPAWLAVLLILLAFMVYYSVFVGFRQRPKIYWLLFSFVLFIALIYYGFIAPQDFTPIWILAVCFSVFVTSAAGITVDRVAYKPLRDAPRISALISAIGMSFLIENLATVLFSGVPKAVKQPEIIAKPILWQYGEGASGIIRIVPMAIIVPIVTVVLVIALLFIINKTKPGLAMRAISRDIETTRLMGVSVNKIIAFTFGLGSALAAIAGIMWALRYPQIHPYMGIVPGLKAFIAAVIGGIGSIQGAMLGGLLLGFIEIMIIAFFPELSGYRDAFAFILLILILLVMPTGIMGKKSQEKI